MLKKKKTVKENSENSLSFIDNITTILGKK